MKNTKLILTHDVPNLGLAGEVVTVAGGYARNYLIPRRFAQLWTKGGQRQIDSLERARKRREIASVQDARAIRDALVSAGFVEVAKKAGDSGRLFGAVSAADIAKAINEKLQVKVDRRQVVVNEAIKAVGEFQVKVVLHADVETELTVKVIAE